MVHPTGSISDKSHIPQYHQPVSKQIPVCLNQLYLPGSISPLLCFGRYKWWFSLVRRESDCVCARLRVRCVSPPGHGFCSCGRCICSDGWFGKHCQFPRSCDMTDEQSKSLCVAADGIICSGKGRRDDASSGTLRRNIIVSHLLKMKVGSLICLVGNELSY